MELTNLPTEIIEEICRYLSIKDAIEMYNTKNTLIQALIQYTFIDIIKNEKYLDKTTKKPEYDEFGLKEFIREQFYGDYIDEHLMDFGYDWYINHVKTSLWNDFKKIAKYFSSHSKEWHDKQNFIVNINDNKDNYFYIGYTECCILNDLSPEIFNIINKECFKDPFMNWNNYTYYIEIWIEKLKPFSLKEIKYISRFLFVPYGCSIETYDHFNQIKKKLSKADFLKFLKYSSLNFSGHGIYCIDLLFLIKLIIECDMGINNVIEEYEKLPVVFYGNKFKYGDDNTEPTEEMQRLIDSYKKKLA
jgi:hypothetical protein